MLLVTMLFISRHDLDPRHQMKVLRFLLILASLLLASCADLPGGATDSAFASAVTRNSISGVMRTCSPRNASVPIRGVPPMAYAAGFGNEDMIDVLYNNGASLNVRNPRGQSLAYLAASNGHRSTANKLVKLGSGSSADVSRGSSEYAEKRAATVAAERRLASQRANANRKSERQKDGDSMADYLFRTWQWNNGPPSQWYHKDTPRPTYN
jgi:hypothetical protein